MGWFDVDKAGLAAILERRGKGFAVFELLSNAWDSGATEVNVSIEAIPGEAAAHLSVTDDGEGFADLAHANTMFARSNRAGNAEKRGRFNLGEKLVLSVCRCAEIATTKGTVKFLESGEVRRSSQTTDGGTRFTAVLRLTRDELREIEDAMRRTIPPVRTAFNDVELDRPDSLCRFETRLPTEIEDADGRLRRSTRVATVEVYRDENGPGEILELGIPVVETENGYRVNVLQKVPLNMERDNVTPAFLKAVQATLLNHVHNDLDAEAAAKPWAQEAAGDARATPEAVKAVITKRFGEHAVIATPNDPVANANAAARGFTVISGGALSSDLWANVKKADVLLPASKVFPTPRPESLAAASSAAADKVEQLAQAYALLRRAKLAIADYEPEHPLIREIEAHFGE